MEGSKTTIRRSVYYNPAAKSYRAPETKDNSAEIKAFYASLPDYAPTKLVPLPKLAKELGVKSVYVKAETSRLGLPSFKLLGASWAVRQAIIHHAKLPSNASLDDLRTAVQDHGINLCAATDGNHGRSVAFMGRMLGVKQTKVFVPRGLDEKIIASIANEGAEVVVANGDYDETVRTAHRFGEKTEGFMLIEAVAYEGYEDVPRWAVEGYTTMLHEVDAQLQVHNEVASMVIAPVGVGSLTQAIISYYKSPNKTSKPPSIVTIEPDTAATLYKSLKADQSLSINTSPTIMAGLECGTLSSIAWTLLKDGVDASATISDLECHEAILYLAKNDVGAGPCGAAALAGLRRMTIDASRKGLLDESSVVVCICTEGTRPYEIPIPVEDDKVKLWHALTWVHKQSPFSDDEKICTGEVSRSDIKTATMIMNYAAQWLEYRDIGIQWLNAGTPHSVLLASVTGRGTYEGEERDEKKRKSLLLVTLLLDTDGWLRRWTSKYMPLTSNLLTLSQLNSSVRFGVNITVAIILTPSQTAIKSILGTLGPVDGAIIVDAAFEDLATSKLDQKSNFVDSVKQSVEGSVNEKVRLQVSAKKTLLEATGLRLLLEREIPACVFGHLGNHATDADPELSMVNALVKIAEDWCT
ncbi:related to diaminopropionate ammonia-lyase [Phialocephala subalpina]|uniref:Related to diaminopropionate ammonia-lyase n=1 Tax=Phialocephala subalpina TaxID=576137 RepID=A0A1L7XGY9_9HELO|nr:related to diaminopropionate ammonia-lyase [Phialocephala subalpina]